MTKTRSLLIGLFAALCLNACILEEEKSCTLIYCQDSVTLTVIDKAMGSPIESFKGSATVGGKVIDFECSPDKRGDTEYNCFGPNSVTIKGAPPNSVTVNITSPGEPTEEIITLMPTTREPNGPGCGTCTQATATIKVAAE